MWQRSRDTVLIKLHMAYGGCDCVHSMYVVMYVSRSVLSQILIGRHVAANLVAVWSVSWPDHDV